MASKQKYSYLSGIDTFAASDGNPHLKRTLDGLVNQMNAITAGQQTFDTDSGSQSSPAPPASADFKVQGIDGKFVIDIVNPQDITPLSQQIRQQNNLSDLNATGQTIIHQLRSADDLAITTNVVTYDADSAVHKEIQQPNVTKYWQMRSSFDGTNWNDWQYFVSASVCGPAPVWSGLLRNSSSVLNDVASTPTGANPCTQHLTTMQIDVASSVWKCGDQTINYNSGSVTPGSFGTFYVYARDPQRLGGSVTFVAATANSDVTADVSNIYFGKITTSGGGGGTGSGGGGGSCCRAGVPYQMFDGTSKDASEVRLQNVIKGVDGGPEVVQRIIIHPKRPCFRLEFDAAGKLTVKTYIGDFTVYQLELDRSHTFLVGSGNVIDGASSNHTIQYAGGGFTDVFGACVGEDFNLIDGAVGSHNYLKQ